MTWQTDLTLGNVRFAVSSPVPLTGTIPSPAYAEFVAPAVPTDHVFPVELIAGTPPPLDTAECVFEAGDMWALFRDGDRRIVAHTGWGLKHPMWAAELPPGLDQASVYCGPVLEREVDGVPGLASPLRYPLDQLLLGYALARREGTILHAAGLVYEGHAWLLAGVSGAGKSTAAQLLQGIPGLTLLSDDRIIVARTEGRFMAYGTPWPGEARVACRQAAPLGGVLFLNQASQNRVTAVASRDAVRRLMPVAAIPWHEPDVFPSTVAFCGAMAEGVPCAEFSFALDAGAAAKVLLAALVSAPAWVGQRGTGEMSS